MKKLALILSLLLLCSCAPKPQMESYFAMDTIMQATIYGKADVEEIIMEYDDIFSPTKQTSTLSTYNRGEWVHNEIFDDVLFRAGQLAEKTDYAFSPNLGNLIDLWNREVIPSEAEINEAITAPKKINLSAIAKGALSDAILKELCDKGVKRAILSLGGNIIAHGTRSDGSDWIVGVRDPDGNENEYIATIGVKDKFVVSSGDYERYFEENGVRYHHILDPKTGYPVKGDLRSVTIVSNDGALADAYSTALFVMGSEKALEFWRKEGDFEAIFVLDDKVIITDGIKNFNLTDEGYTYEVANR